MEISFVSGGICAPSDRRTLAVDSTSADCSIPRIRDSPLPRAPQMSERCEMDLSPGTRTVPRAFIEASAPKPLHDPFFHRGISRSQASAVKGVSVRPNLLRLVARPARLQLHSGSPGASPRFLYKSPLARDRTPAFLA